MSLTEFPVEKSLDQCKWLFYAVILGFFLCAIYEIFRAFRSEIRHKNFAVFLEDVFFFVICAFVFDYQRGRKNQNILPCRLLCGQRHLPHDRRKIYKKVFFVDNRFIYEDL